MGSREQTLTRMTEISFRDPRPEGTKTSPSVLHVAVHARADPRELACYFPQKRVVMLFRDVQCGRLATPERARPRG